MAEAEVVTTTAEMETDADGPIVDNQDEDHDMTMAEAGVGGEGAIEDSSAAEAPVKQEVKLEDLFADVESDEEFPSSTGQDIKTSSSPEAPASPMLVN